MFRVLLVAVFILAVGVHSMLGVYIGYTLGTIDSRSLTAQKELLDERQKILELREKGIKEKEDDSTRWRKKSAELFEEADRQLNTATKLLQKVKLKK